MSEHPHVYCNVGFVSLGCDIREVADGLPLMPASADFVAVRLTDRGCTRPPHLAVQVLGRAVKRSGVLARAAWPAHCGRQYIV